jgi:hypothetical protein
MKLGWTIAVFLLAAYFFDGQFYDGKFSGAANQIVSRAMASFR